MRDLKRGFGGLVDVKFLLQAFQLKYGRTHPSIWTPNTWQALDALRMTGLIAQVQFRLASCQTPGHFVQYKPKLAEL